MKPECGRVMVLLTSTWDQMVRPCCVPSSLVCRSPGHWCEGRAYGYAPCFRTMTILVHGSSLAGRCRFFHLPLPCLLPAKVAP